MEHVPLGTRDAPSSVSVSVSFVDAKSPSLQALRLILPSSHDKPKWRADGPGNLDRTVEPPRSPRRPRSGHGVGRKKDWKDASDMESVQ